MKLPGELSFNHEQADKIGVLITNLGTPDAPNSKAVRRYLREFLSDPRVVEFPKLAWWLILNGIILRIRPRRSAKLYQAIWQQEGSPLLIHTQNQAKALKPILQEAWGDQIIVEFAMRYGKPSISSALESMLQKGVRKLLVLPLYPQYSASTVASTFDAVAADFSTRRWLPELRFINQYHDFSPYISASATQIQQFWQQHGRPGKLIFSYHGIPKRYWLQGDPYHCQCQKTSRLIAEALQLKENEYMTCFQSRFGREEWLKPYIHETLTALPQQGCQSVQVFCPGFAADCLETLEEIAVENKKLFITSGGANYQYIPALNAEPEHIRALAELIRLNLQGWQIDSDNSMRARLARAMGARS